MGLAKLPNKDKDVSKIIKPTDATTSGMPPAKRARFKITASEKGKGRATDPPPTTPVATRMEVGPGQIAIGRGLSLRNPL